MCVDLGQSDDGMAGRCWTAAAGILTQSQVFLCGWPPHLALPHTLWLTLHGGDRGGALWSQRPALRRTSVSTEGTEGKGLSYLGSTAQ